MQGETAHLANCAGFHEVNGGLLKNLPEDHVKPVANEGLAVRLEKAEGMMALRSLEKTWVGAVKDYRALG